MSDEPTYTLHLGDQTMPVFVEQFGSGEIIVTGPPDTIAAISDAPNDGTWSIRKYPSAEMIDMTITITPAACGHHVPLPTARGEEPVIATTCRECDMPVYWSAGRWLRL